MGLMKKLVRRDFIFWALFGMWLGGGIGLITGLMSDQSGTEVFWGTVLITVLSGVGSSVSGTYAERFRTRSRNRQ